MVDVQMRINIIDGLHQPAYTGKNRCEPCTVLNLVIAALLGSFIARKSNIGGLIAVLVSVGLIYLRGHLVPGTPTLTKQYLPPTVLRWFGKEPAPKIATGLGDAETATTPPADGPVVPNSVDESTATEESTTGSGTTTDTSDMTSDERLSAIEDLETYFVEQKILELCTDSDDLCLTKAFETAWFEEVEPLTDSELTASEVADVFGFDADLQQFELVTYDEARLLRSESKQIGQWPSRPALVADLAASRVLSSWVSDWNVYDPQEKGQLLNALRMFLETCPTTDGDIHMGEEVVESCCSSHTVIAMTCEETGKRLFEHRLDNIDD